MPVAYRRAPRGVRRFSVLQRFRYMRRVYEVGDVFMPRGDVPRSRLDRLWRDGSIGTLEGDRCPAEKATPVDAAQAPTPSPVSAAIDAGEFEEDPTLFGEDYQD